MAKAGVYKIQSLIKPDRIYIGSAMNIPKRWSYHRVDLRNNRHGNDRLQNHFNKYGESDLQFSVLLECSKEQLITREQDFIDALNPYFNICRIAGSSLGRTSSEATKEKLRAYNKLHNIKPPSRLGVEVSDDARNNMRKTQKGNKNASGAFRSAEWRQQVSKSLKESLAIKKQKGEQNGSL